MIRLYFLAVVLIILPTLAASQIVHQYKLKSQNQPVYINNARMDADNNLIVGGYRYDSTLMEPNQYMAKLDRDGNTLWANVCSIRGINTDGIVNILPDSGYSIATIEYFPAISIFTKDGSLVSSEQLNFGGMSPKSAASATLPNGSNIVVGSYSTHNDDFDLYGNPSMGWAIVTDGLFGIKWRFQAGIERMYSHVRFNDVAVMGNAIYIAGTASRGAGYTQNQSLLLKLDTNGTILNRYYFDEPVITGTDTFYSHAIENLQVTGGQLLVNIKAASRTTLSGDTLIDKESQIVGRIDTATGALSGTLVRLPGFNYLNLVKMYSDGIGQYYLTQSPSRRLTSKQTIIISKIAANSVLYARQMDGDSSKIATSVFAVNDTITIVGNTPTFQGMTGYIASIYPGTSPPVVGCPVSSPIVTATPIDRVAVNLPELHFFNYPTTASFGLLFTGDSLDRTDHCIPERWPANSVSMISENAELLMYPNPTHDYFYVTKNADELLALTIIDLAGKVVPVESIVDEKKRYRVVLHKGLIGMYYCVFKTKSGVYTRKLLTD